MMVLFPTSASNIDRSASSSTYSTISILVTTIATTSSVDCDGLKCTRSSGRRALLCVCRRERGRGVDAVEVYGTHGGRRGRSRKGDDVSRLDGGET